MRTLFAVIRNAFSPKPLPPSPPPAQVLPPLGKSATSEQRDKIRQGSHRRIAAQNTSGNVFLQRGKFLTQADLDERRERVLAYQWDDE